MRNLFCATAIAASFFASALGAAEICETAAIKGRYAFHGQLWDLRASPPSPATVGGTFNSDGAGTITEWRDVLTTSVLEE